MSPQAESDTLKWSFPLDHGILENTKNLVIWNDILNYSFTSHEINDNIALIPKKIAIKYESRTTALVYCERLGALQAFDDYRDQKLTVIRVTESFLSRRKQNNIPLLDEYSRLHLVADIKLGSLFIDLDHRNNLKSISQRSRSKKPSQSKRR